MASKKLSAFSAKKRRLDICMFTTQTAPGILNSRPTSNNGDVEYDGNSYFFSYEDSSVVKDILETPIALIISILSIRIMIEITKAFFM